MSESASKKFDCVRSMRQIREEISAAISGMTYDELAEWLRAEQHDPILERLMGEPAQPTVGADGPGPTVPAPAAERPVR